MKIAFLCHSCETAGAETVMVNMANQLANRENVEVCVITPYEGPLKDRVHHDRVRFCSLDVVLPSYWWVPDETADFMNLISQSNTVAKKLAEKLEYYGIEVLVVNALVNIVGLLAAAELNIPYVLWSHGIGDHTLYPQFNYRTKNFLDHLQIHQASAMVCPSTWTKNYFAPNRTDIVVVPNFTSLPDPESIQDFPHIPTFVCLSTFEKHKGHMLLLQAAKVLFDRGLQFQLRFYGAGPELLNLQQYVSENQLDGFVAILNRNDFVAKVYGEATAVVTASAMDSFGMTIIEGFAHGRPVIASSIGGHQEVFRDQDELVGYLVPELDAGAFADKMEVLAKDRNLAIVMGRKAYEFAKVNYNGKNSEKIFYDVLSDVLKKEELQSTVFLRNRYIHTEFFRWYNFEIMVPPAVTAYVSPEAEKITALMQRFPYLTKWALRGGKVLWRLLKKLNRLKNHAKNFFRSLTRLWAPS